jgi:integrase/recombinase XerD
MSLVPYQAPATLDQVLRLVLDAVSSPSTRVQYGKALADFFQWRAEQGSPAFSRASVQAHRAALESRGYAPATVNQRLAAIKKLAREAAANGLLDAAVAAAIDQVPGVRQSGTRAGNWLTKAQAEALINAPDPNTRKGTRDRALLALLVGCGLRRAEAVALTVEHVQQRDGRWVIVDLRGKHGRLRSVAVPAWVKQAVDRWAAAAGITEGRILRSLNRHGQITGDSLSPQAVFAAAVFYGDQLGLRLRPHDLRRTCAKLCRAGGGDLEQIQLLLGHASIQTTERYLGTRQNLADAPNDRLGLAWKGED